MKAVAVLFWRYYCVCFSVSCL